MRQTLRNSARNIKMKSKNHFKFRLLVCMIMFLSCMGVGNAASFNCAKASIHVEKIICSDAELSKLDDSLGRLFSFLPDGGNSVVINQKKWLRETRNACNDSQCLKTVYSARITELTNVF